MPRRRRIKSQDESFYHIVTRVVDKVFRFTEDENYRNVALLRRVEEFSAVQVVAFCFMSNHLHILLRVPRREFVSEEELLHRLEVLYGLDFRLTMEDRWSSFRGNGLHRIVDEEQERFRRRMFDMGEFMKTLKQRLTMSYNGRHERTGTLWEERYKSLLLESSPSVLSAVAAYIDLNPVRAGIVSDPKDYRFSSYGEACAGSIRARDGLRRIYRERDFLPEWKSVAPLYRLRLVLKAVPSEKRAGMSRDDVLKAIDNKGCLSLAEILGCRLRYFTHGIALGSADFIQHIRAAWRQPIPLQHAPPPYLSQPGALATSRS